MPIAIVCPACSARIRLPDNAAGKRWRCPKCQGVVTGPAGEKRRPVVSSDGIDPHLTDESTREDQSLDEGPIPLRGRPFKGADDYNPFADGTSTDEDANSRKARAKRHCQPKDDYNPFAEPRPAPAETTDTDGSFDFGAAGPPPPPPAGEFDFGTGRPTRDDTGKRRRRR